MKAVIINIVIALEFFAAHCRSIRFTDIIAATVQEHRDVDVQSAASVSIKHGEEILYTQLQRVPVQTSYVYTQVTYLR